MSIAFKKGNRFVATKANREAQLPSLPRQAMNFAGSVMRSVRSVATGNRLKASPETVASRQKICQTCPHITSDQRCSKCGCPTSMRGFIPDKTQLFAEFCPIKRWGPGEIKNAETQHAADSSN